MKLSDLLDSLQMLEEDHGGDVEVTADLPADPDYLPLYDLPIVELVAENDEHVYQVSLKLGEPTH
jgi:hypothetical protein